MLPRLEGTEAAASSLTSRVCQVQLQLPVTAEQQAESEESGLLLVVDDNEENRDVLARRLQKQGHWAVTVASGHEALDRSGRAAV